MYIADSRGGGGGGGGGSPEPLSRPPTALAAGPADSGDYVFHTNCGDNTALSNGGKTATRMKSVYGQLS